METGGKGQAKPGPINGPSIARIEPDSAKLRVTKESKTIRFLKIISGQKYFFYFYFPDEFMSRDMGLIMTHNYVL